MWNFSRGIDSSVFKLEILTVMDKPTTWSDYFRSDIFILHCNYLRNKFRAKTAVIRFSLPSRIGFVAEHPAV